MISIEFSFHFSFLWYFSFVINFPRFFKRLLRPMKILLLTFPEQLSTLIISVKFNVWGTFLSNYKHFSCQSSRLLLLLEVCKNHYEKENISVGVSGQRRDALFWIHLRQTWPNLFGLILAALSFSSFIFSIGIKLFFRHPIVLFGILILLEQVDDFMQLPPWCILKDRQLCPHKYLKHWGKINQDTRYDID